MKARCLCWFSAAILVSHVCTPARRLHKKLYKIAWNFLRKKQQQQQQMVHRTDFDRLYVLESSIIFHFLDWLLSLNDFKFFCSFRDIWTALYRRIDGILLSSSKYGKRQMVMKNKPGDRSKWETVEHFAWIIIQNSLRWRANQIAQNAEIAEWFIIHFIYI